MFDFLKKLLGQPQKSAAQPPRSAQVGDLLPKQESRRAVDRYYSTMAQLQSAISKRNYEVAVKHVRANLKEIPSWLEAEKREFGSFDIRSIPALESGGTGQSWVTPKGSTR